MRRDAYWLSVDPGCAGTGFALMKGAKVHAYKSIYPDKECVTWEHKTSSIMQSLMWHTFLKKIERVYIEWPSQFTGAKGLAAANSNDILKLSCLIGRISQYFVEKNATVILVPVQRWKGNLPKNVVSDRAKKFFGLKKLTSHAADAVGLARYALLRGGKHD